jgi:magnesium transporter
MITSVLYSSGKISFNLPKDILAKTIAQPENIVWTDIRNPDNEDIATLDEVFHFHPLAIEHCITASHTPKVLNFGECIFITFFFLGFDAQQKGIRAVPLNIFIGKNHVVTCHREEVESIPEAFEMIKQNPAQTLGQGADFTAYIILDLTTEHYTKLLDSLNARMDKSEEHIYTAKVREMSGELFRIKKDILLLRRIISPLRDGTVRLTREDIPILSKQVKIYFYDIHDRLFRICETIDTYKDILIGTQDLQLSIISNKTNTIVKTLTIITTIIMPLSLITGIYGMNFKYMPETKWHYGYYAILLGMLCIALMSLAIFKKKKWF